MARMERALQFIRRGAELAADHVRPIEVGTVLTAPSLPGVFGVNQLRIVQPVRFADLLELAERHQQALPFRHVVVEHEATGARLEHPFRAAGWKLERDLVMALGNGPDRPIDAGTVIEPDEDRMAAMMTRWHLDAHPDAPAKVLHELAQYSRREGRVRPERRLALTAADGDLAAITKLRSERGTAQVEDVYTVPEARGRGYARTLISHAIARAKAAGADYVFIVADDQDWPQQLYRRLGFEPLGRISSFHLDLGGGR